MSRALLLLVVLTASASCGLAYVLTPPADVSLIAPGTSPPPHVRRFDRVLIVVLENQDYEKAIKAPELARLATVGASFRDYHALFHPSYSNYLAMVSGRIIRTSHDRQKEVDGSTIADQLEANGLSWNNYAEGYPGETPRPNGRFQVSAGGCVMDGDIGDRYRRKHVPFLSFVSVLSQQPRCARVVGGDRLQADLKANALPNYAFYTPDMINDGHDPVSDPSKGLQRSNDWLKSFLAPILADQSSLARQLIVVTYDESKETSTRDNHIYTVLLGGAVKPGVVVESNYNHFNLLRTIEDNFGLTPMADGDRNARPITEVWKE